MHKGLSLTELAQKIEGNKGLKKDFIASTNKIDLIIQDKTLAPKHRKPALIVPDVTEPFKILPLAHDQIGSYTKIPAPYYDRMLAEQPELLVENVNTWLHATPKRKMIRTLGGSTRALLSDRYQRIENEEIAETALPVLFDLPGVQIVSCEVTERRLYIHFVVPTVQGEVKKGDVVQAGGIIQNSEVGLSSVSVSGLLWRLICLNGMKTQEAFRRNHIGRRVEEDGEIDWSDDTRKADDRAVLLKVRDMVRAVVDQVRFRENLDKMRALTTGELKGDVVKAVEVLAQKLTVTEGEKGSILQALIKGADLSAWGVVNAVTAQAHQAQNYDRAVEFEAMGGKLLNLPKTEWREVLEAA